MRPSILSTADSRARRSAPCGGKRPASDNKRLALGRGQSAGAQPGRGVRNLPPCAYRPARYLRQEHAQRPRNPADTRSAPGSKHSPRRPDVRRRVKRHISHHDVSEHHGRRGWYAEKRRPGSQADVYAARRPADPIVARVTLYSRY